MKQSARLRQSGNPAVNSGHWHTQSLFRFLQTRLMDTGAQASGFIARHVTGLQLPSINGFLCNSSLLPLFLLLLRFTPCVCHLQFLQQSLLPSPIFQNKIFNNRLHISSSLIGTPSSPFYSLYPLILLLSSLPPSFPWRWPLHHSFWAILSLIPPINSALTFSFSRCLIIDDVTSISPLTSLRLSIFRCHPKTSP